MVFMGSARCPRIFGVLWSLPKTLSRDYVNLTCEVYGRSCGMQEPNTLGILGRLGNPSWFEVPCGAHKTLTG